jgi:hypothetical protein
MTSNLVKLARAVHFVAQKKQDRKGQFVTVMERKNDRSARREVNAAFTLFDRHPGTSKHAVHAKPIFANALPGPQGHDSPFLASALAYADRPLIH